MLSRIGVPNCVYRPFGSGVNIFDHSTLIVVAEQSAQPLATVNCALTGKFDELGSDYLVA